MRGLQVVVSWGFALVAAACFAAEDRKKEEAGAPLEFGLPKIHIAQRVGRFHEGHIETTRDGTWKWISILQWSDEMPDGRKLPMTVGDDYSIRLLGGDHGDWIQPLLGPQNNQLYKFDLGKEIFRQPDAKEIPAGVTPRSDSYCIPVKGVGQLDGVLYEVVRAEWSAADNKVVADVMVGPGKVRRRLDLWAGSDLETPKRRYRVRSVVAREGNKRLAGWIELDPFGVAVEDAKEKEQEKK